MKLHGINEWVETINENLGIDDVSKWSKETLKLLSNYKVFDKYPLAPLFKTLSI